MFSVMCVLNYINFKTLLIHFFIKKHRPNECKLKKNFLHEKEKPKLIRKKSVNL